MDPRIYEVTDRLNCEWSRTVNLVAFLFFNVGLLIGYLDKRSE